MNEKTFELAKAFLEGGNARGMKSVELGECLDKLDDFIKAYPDEKKED